MNEYQIISNQLLTEGDVEVKVVLPLLTNPEPIGLGFSLPDIKSKHSLKKLQIEKGEKAILYYPDFVISIKGIPVIVIEAKKPGEDLEEAYRQASLYAGEINRFFQAGLNPCELIIASDGLNLMAGSWDDRKAKFMINIENWMFTDGNFNAFLNTFSKDNLNKKSTSVRKSIRTVASYKNPLTLLGGKHIQSQSISNSFGEAISIQYQHLFNPNEETERQDIVKNAYVRVTKHQSHVDPIDKLIRKKIAPSMVESVELENNENPKEIIAKLSKAHNYNNQVILLIGSVGSGKSTFSTYLREVALHRSILDKTCWVTMDLNDAPVSSEEIYSWLKKRIIKQIKSRYPEIDFEELRFIERLYVDEINSLKKGVLQLLEPKSEKYNEILVEKLLEFQANVDLTLNCYIRELVHKKGKDLIIILDNCDKRTLEEQLLMFEVANWIKDNIKAIVFLPLRDTTFDHFRNEKPLDTVIKDLIFRINPPSLEKVIYERIKYANRLARTSKDRFYLLPNGWKVKYPSEDELYYLKSILSSLFQNRFFKRLISGLAGRDVRKGIEVFLDFCKSGHITEKEILIMRQKKGEFILPNHIISRVFMRGNRLFYSDVESRIKNVFHSDPSDDLPDPFIRLSILKYLNDNRRQRGPSGILGFHKVSEMLESLSRFGHSPEKVQFELLFLLKNSLVVSESQDSTEIKIDELISINPPGVVHFELVKNIDYLSTMAEDLWYKQVSVAEKIAKNISGMGSFAHLSIENSVTHSNLLVDYLKSYYIDHFEFQSQYISNSDEAEPMNFDSLLSDISAFESKQLSSGTLRLANDSIHSAKVVNIQKYGIICEIIGTNKVGLIHSSELDLDFDGNYKLGDILKVKIKEYRAPIGKYSLNLIE